MYDFETIFCRSFFAHLTYNIEHARDAQDKFVAGYFAQHAEELAPFVDDCYHALAFRIIDDEDTDEERAEYADYLSEKLADEVFNWEKNALMSAIFDDGYSDRFDLKALFEKSSIDVIRYYQYHPSKL